MGGARGGRARTSGRAGSVSTSICRGRVCPKPGHRPTTDRLADGRGRTLVLLASFGEAPGGSGRIPLRLATTSARATSTRRVWRCGNRFPPVGPRAVQPGPPPRPPAASPSPRSPPGCPEQRCSGAPNSGCRGKCLHEPRGCPGSTTRVLKSVVASNISYLASMSYFG